ncbi:MAG: hypothetical protein N2508_05670 [Anaerolineae bacterium]|nr:hypothetical protein [Anaerolineae bacterium]
MMTAQLVVYGLEDGLDPLGLWQMQTAPALSFAADKGVPAAPTWQVALPGASVEAQAALAEQLLALQLALADLERVREELLALVAGGEVAYAATSDALSACRAELLSAVHAARAYSFDQRLSVGLLEDRESFFQWVALVKQVQKLVGNYVYVETTLGGREIGRTTVNWLGDFETIWRSVATAGEAELHQQAVRLALDSRTALLRVVTVVVTGAFEIAVKASVPGMQIFLLPAVWRFVRDVLAELRKARVR